MGAMRIIDNTGDTLVEWAPQDVASIEAAEKVFNDLRDRRQLAFARPAGSSVEEAERIYAFDPSAEEILWVRPITGG